MGVNRGLLVAGVALAGLAAAGWLLRDAPWLREAWARVAPHPGAPAQATAGLRKCLRANGEVLYTDQACPGATRALGVGGQLTVVAGQPAAPAAASSPPHARDLLLQPDAVGIKARRMEEAIGR